MNIRSHEIMAGGSAQSRLIERYLELGWVVLPTSGPTSKHPDVHDWPNAPAETDPAAFEGRGIYLVCGERSGVDVIDIDGPEHRRPLVSLARRYGAAIATTPSGGLHLFVGHDPELGWRNTVCKVDGVDIRTTAGGVVLPDGRDGRRWKRSPWSSRPPRGEQPVDPGPFDDYLRTVDQPTTPGSDEGRTTHGRSMLLDLLNRPAEVGGRNHWLSTVAGHYARWLPAWELVEWHVWAANDRLPVPLEPEEVRSTVLKSARRWWIEAEQERRQLRKLRKRENR